MKMRLRYRLVRWLLGKLTIREVVATYFDTKRIAKELRRKK